MKKVLALLFCLLPSLAVAQIVPSLPYNLTNGTIADANQVMADFNAIVAGVNTNAANAGANTNITALNGLTAPLAPASGGSSVYTGGSSGGTLNAQTLLSPTPLGFTLTQGRRVTFIAGFTNSGATTLNVNSTGAIAVLKQSTSGLVALTGGEIVVNQAIDVWYDGTQYEILNAAPQSLVPTGTIIDNVSLDTPSGYLNTDGAAVARASFVNLFANIARSRAANTTSGSGAVVLTVATTAQVGWYVGGTNVTCNSQITVVTDSTHFTINNNAGATGATTLTFGPYPQGDCSTTFNVPYLSGRATVSVDPAGAALTSATCTNPGTLGAVCGSQVVTLAAANIPTLTSVNAAQSISVTSSANVTQNATYISYINAGGGGTTVLNALPTNTPLTSTGSNSISTTYTNGSLTSVNKVMPIGLVSKLIKT